MPKTPWKYLTYGIMPSYENFRQSYENELPNGNYSIGNDKIVGDRVFTSAKELYDYIQWLVIKWQSENDDNQKYGDLASNILYTLKFEWI